MGLLRVVYALILGAGIMKLVEASFLVQAEMDEQLSAQVFSLISSFDSWWSIGLVFAGVHLITLGFLANEGTRWTKVWAVLLIIAGLGYVVVQGAMSLGLPYETLEMVLSVPMFIGEVGYAVWLVIYGGQKE